jgi:hypothetical protein
MFVVSDNNDTVLRGYNSINQSHSTQLSAQHNNITLNTFSHDEILQCIFKVLVHSGFRLMHVNTGEGCVCSYTTIASKRLSKQWQKSYPMIQKYHNINGKQSQLATQTEYV